MSNDSNQAQPKQYASVWTALYAPETAMPKTMVSIVRNHWGALTKDPAWMEKACQHLTKIEQGLLSRWVEGPNGISAELFLKVWGLLLTPQSSMAIFDEDLGYCMTLTNTAPRAEQEPNQVPLRDKA